MDDHNDFKEDDLVTVMVPVVMPNVLRNVMSMFDPNFEKLGYFFASCLKDEIDEWKANKDKDGAGVGFNLSNIFKGNGWKGSA